MEEIYETFVKTSLIFGGDKKMMLFTFQKAVLNVLGFDWFEANNKRLKMLVVSLLVMMILFTIGWDLSLQWMILRKSGVHLPLPVFIKHIFYPAFYPTLMVTVAVLTLMHVFTNHAVTQYDFIQKINGCIVSMTFFAATFKAVVFMIWRKSIRQMYEKVEELGNLDTELPNCKHHIRICFAYATLVASNAGTWAAWGLYAHHDAPFKSCYPWSDSGITFSLTMACGFFSAVFCALCHIMVDTTFQMAVAGITLHLDALSERLSLLGTGNKFKDHVNISTAIDQHVQLLKIGDHLSYCYSNVFVAQSVYTVVHSCVILFGALHVEDKVEVAMSQGTMLATSYMQLLIYCYYGELLTTKFSDLIFASYDNGWYNCDLSVKRALVKVSLMSHKHVSLRGFGNVQPSKSNWLHSLQDSVSYFLFLKTMTGED